MECALGFIIAAARSAKQLAFGAEVWHRKGWMKSPFPYPVAALATRLTVAFSVVVVAACGSGGGTQGTNPSDASLPDDGATSPDGSLLASYDGGHDGGGNADEGGSLFDATLGGDGGISSGQCVPRTCFELGASCGPQGDGCGNLIQCGNCKAPQTCGGGGTLNACGGAAVDGGTCVPKTCADWQANCGPVSDGCGGLVQCGSCTAPQTCGGGGTPSQCGGNNGCAPATCANAGVNCGPVGDGCGGLIQCGSCAVGESCGGGGAPSVCGVPTTPDAGNSGCVPTTCTTLGLDCGPAGDGCGGVLQCGTCTAPETCGGGGTPSQCGGDSGCVPTTCTTLGFDCGSAGDGCGGVLQCGTCTAPTTCGGGGVPSVCGGTDNCVSKTCAELGFNCGPAGDGCGGLLQCGSCTAPEICGGGGQAGVCGPTADSGTSGCTGLCQQQQPCSGTTTTTISGTVYAPNGTDRLYNALVYVPNGGAAPAYGVTAFTAGVHCGQCGSEVSGSPLVSTLTAVDGTFSLQNVPAGANIPLVVQLGRWRRKVTIPSVAQCTNTALAANMTRLPSSQPGSSTYPPAWYPAGDNDTADNIPLMAFSTGAVDALECVMLKIGIDQSQFSDPAAQGGTGRVRLYTGESPEGFDTGGNQVSRPGRAGVFDDAVGYPALGRREARHRPVRHGLLPLPGR